MQVQRQVRVQVGAGASEAVDDGIPQRRAVLAEDGDEGVVGVALVKEDRKAQLGGQLELGAETANLVRLRGIVSIEIEAAFAERDDARPSRHRAQLRQPIAGRFHGVMGMNAGRGVQGGARGLRRQVGRRVAPREAGARDHQRIDAGRGGAVDHRREVVPERLRGQVCADVDHDGSTV